jgi:hypothetical protein
MTTQQKQPTRTELAQKRAHVQDFLLNLPQCKTVREEKYEMGDWWGQDHWLEWGRQVVPGRRGLTLLDIDRPNEQTKEIGESHRSARGAWRDPEMDPAHWKINEKYIVWADSVQSLYEEGAARQWNATRDIPWHRFTPLREDLAKASSSFATMLSMGEYLANDAFGGWLPQINSEFMEVKLFLAGQINDEARHTEVFRKLALIHGTGLGPCYGFFGDARDIAAILGMPIEELARTGGVMPTYHHMSFPIHVVFEGFILSCFRNGEFLGKTEVDKAVYRLVMQDEARHVSYGVSRLKYYLAEANFMTGIMTRPLYMQSVAIMAADGLEDIDQGYKAYRIVWEKSVREYLDRCEKAGFPRRQRTLMMGEPPF